MHRSPSLIPVARQGASFSGLVHLTDWMPTFMALASNGTWKGPASGLPIDGHNVLPAIQTGEASPRTEIFHNFNINGSSAMQIGLVGSASILECHSHITFELG